MTDRPDPTAGTLTRRHFTALGTAALLAPSAVAAQPGVDFEDFAARCRALNGFDPLPRDLVAALMRAMEPLELTAMVERPRPPEALRKRLLTALYTGVHEPADAEADGGDDGGTRIGYANTLMYAAVEDTINVPSYCGGLPGFWAEKTHRR